jgi:hypothetical protein
MSHAQAAAVASAHPGVPMGTRKKYREFGLRPPRGLQTFCRETGGLNEFGGPMYRLSWAPSQLTWMAGTWRINDDQGNFKFWHVDCGYAPKYPQLGERYILETWKAPQAYGSPFEWESMNLQPEDNGQIIGKLGPYPHLGDYEVCFHFQDTDGKYVHPTQTICELRIQEHSRNARKRKFIQDMANAAHRYEQDKIRSDQADILAEPFDGLNGLITPYVSLSGIDVPPAAPAAISTTAQEVSS